MAVKVIAERGMDEPRFEILNDQLAVQAKPDSGTLSRGVGRSPWTGQPIDGDYIKAEAQAGRMWQILYAVTMKVPGGTEFRAPTSEDMEAVKQAGLALARTQGAWTASGLAISETIPYGHRSHERDVVVQYGITEWRHFFTERQLYSLTLALETLLELEPTMQTEIGVEKAAAVLTYLAVAFDKAVSYNAKQSRYDSNRGIRNAFERHDFSFKWSFAEFDASANLFPWVIGQVEGAYRELCQLNKPAQRHLWNEFA